MVFVRRFCLLFVLGLAYFVLAGLTVSMSRFDGGVAFLWVATSLLVAVLIRRPRRCWMGPLLVCSIASILVTGFIGMGWALAFQFAVAGLVEAYIGARLLRSARYGADELGSVSWLIHFVVCIGIVAPAASALFIGSVMALADKPVTPAVVHYFTGHALGNVTFIPIISLAIGGRLKTGLRLATRGKTAESLGLLGLVAAVTAAVFAQSTLPLLFLPILPLTLATFRLGQIGAAISVVIVALIGAGMTLAEMGPISVVSGSPGLQVQFFQFYLAATVLTVLPVSAELRKREGLHRELRLSEERYRLLADHSTDIVMHLETDGRIRFVSPSIAQLAGYLPADIIGSDANLLVAPEFVERVAAWHRATIMSAGQTHSFEYQAMTSEGTRRWFETHSRAVVDEHGAIDGVLNYIRDVSDRKAVEQRLTAAALTDALTDLPNRRAFREAVEQLARQRDPPGTHSLAIFDIDHFKRINDEFGHEAGDEVLRALARRMAASLRPGDGLFRLGGEEFAALLPGTTVDKALTSCERIRIDVAASDLCVVGKMVSITISGGVSPIGEDGIDAAFKGADEALYRAKAAGRDQLYLAA